LNAENAEISQKPQNKLENLARAFASDGAIFLDERQMMLLRLLRWLGDFCVQRFFNLLSFESI